MEVLATHYPQEIIPPGLVALYVLFEPDAVKARYVGITKNYKQRYVAHLAQCRGRQSHKNHWIAHLLDTGRAPFMLSINMGERDQMLKAERAFIANLREAGFPLTNGTDGGDGCKGLTFTTESRRKLSAGLRKPIERRQDVKPPLIRHSKESVERIRLANAGEANHQAKLTWAEVDRMRSLMESGLTNKEVASQFGVSITQATRIRRFESWKP